MKCVCIKDFFFPEDHSHVFVKGKIYVGSAITGGAEFVNEVGVCHATYDSFFDEHFLEIVESKIAKHNKARQVSKDSTQIIRLLNLMSEDARTEVFAEFCIHCGSNNPQCQCWNDE